MGNYPPVLVNIVRGYAVADEAHMLVDWPFEYKEYPSSGDDICIGGHIGLLSHCLTITKHMMDLAAAYNRIKVVQWLYNNSRVGCSHYAMDWAAENGHLRMLKLLRKLSVVGCTSNAMDMAATNGHTNAFKWLFLARADYTEAAFTSAAANNHLAIIKILCRENRFNPSIAMEIAMRTGHRTIHDYIFIHMYQPPETPPNLKSYDYSTRLAEAYCKAFVATNPTVDNWVMENVD